MQKKILIFAQGTIGDMITAMPAMKRICDFHKGDVVHLHNTYPGGSDVHKELFAHLEWFDKMSFTHVAGKLWQTPGQRLRNLLRLRKEKYDVIYELPNNTLSPKWLLTALGAKKLCAMNVLEPAGVPRFRFLLNFLAEHGIPRQPGDEELQLKFTAAEQEQAEQWYSRLPIPAGKIPFAICTGGKNALQHWPLDRYAEVLKEIVPKYHLFPIFFGGDADRKDAAELIRECGNGCSVPPGLTLRETILLLKRCRFYFGNNTGVMHLAGAACLPGLAISPGRDPENYWQPLSEKFRLLTAALPCCGCRRMYCRHVSCIKALSAEKVRMAFADFLKTHSFQQ